jgi:hypothetical protein
MTKNKKHRDKSGDHVEFVVASMTRGDIRALFGNQIADDLTDHDIRKLAKAMRESYFACHFPSELAGVLYRKLGVRW